MQRQQDFDEEEAKQPEASTTGASSSTWSNFLRSRAAHLSIILTAIVVFIFIAILAVLVIWFVSAQGLPEFHIQGNRGARAIMPENSIEGFKKAIDLGIHTLEMDTAISADKQVIVSHDPFMHYQLCYGPKNTNITSLEESKTKYNLYKMNATLIRTFDCGSKPNAEFPRQTKLVTYKPLLTEVIDAVEAEVVRNNLKAIFYNIEIRSSVDTDDLFHPKPAEYAQLLYNIISAKKITRKVFIQSFDIRALKAMRQIDSSIPSSLLVDASTTDYKKAIDSLGFKPAYYSPEMSLVTDEMINYMKQNNIQVIPWVVNSANDIKAMKTIGANGIITDNVDLAMQLHNSGIV